MNTFRTLADEKKILKTVEAQLTPVYQVKWCGASHDVTHIIGMIKIAEMITDPKDANLFLLKIAIWFHNIDRSRYLGSSSASEATFVTNIAHLGLTPEEIGLIVDAVEKHSRLNDEEDSMLLRYLKDCDRLDIAGAIGILKIGASGETRHPVYTLLDFSKERGRRSTKEEDLTSILHSLDRTLEWEGMLRTPKAKEFGERRFTFMRKFRAEVERELKELGIL